MAFTPFETSTTNISTLSDRPNQNDGLSSAQLKGRFDKAGNDIKTYLNDVLLEELERTTDGGSGADNIGATAVGDGTAETVQGILEEIDADVTALDGAAVHLTGDETIDDVKTFSSSPIVPAPTADTQASTKKYVDDADALKVNITDIVNDLTTGGTAVPLSAEQGKTLKGEVGALTSLSTTEKGSLVGAINELDTDIGTHTTAIGTLASLTTAEKTNLVGAINEVDADVGTNATAIGTLASLTTTEKTNLVGAINELDTDKIETSAITNTLTETGTGKVLDARQGKAISDKIGNQSYTEKNYIADGESATSSINKLDMHLKDTADLFSINRTKINEKTSYGVYTGLVVAQQTAPDMTVKVSAGTIYMANGDRFTPSAVASLAVTEADATNPRIDIVYVSSLGAVSYLAGTAAASPSAPAVPSGGQKLAEISVANGATTVVTANIADKRRLNFQGEWITPTLKNGWSHGTRPLRYRKDSSGRVWFMGTISGGTVNDALSMPNGYYPISSALLQLTKSDGGFSLVLAQAQTTSGIFMYSTSGNGYISFDGVSYPTI